MKRTFMAAIAVVCVAAPAYAKPHHRYHHTVRPSPVAAAPCTTVSPGRTICPGEAVGEGFYQAREEGLEARRSNRAPRLALGREDGLVSYLPHPRGCPAVAFCACGAAVRVFGRPIRALWPVAAWRRMPGTSPAPGMVAVERRRSHVFVLESHVSGTEWMVSDYNSGGHLSRRHVRDISGLRIVDPMASAYARQHVAQR